MVDRVDVVGGKIDDDADANEEEEFGMSLNQRGVSRFGTRDRLGGAELLHLSRVREWGARGTSVAKAMLRPVRGNKWTTVVLNNTPLAKFVHAATTKG
jgi:hypothetical protein